MAAVAPSPSRIPSSRPPQTTGSFQVTALPPPPPTVDTLSPSTAKSPTDTSAKPSCWVSFKKCIQRIWYRIVCFFVKLFPCCFSSRTKLTHQIHSKLHDLGKEIAKLASLADQALSIIERTAFAFKRTGPGKEKLPKQQIESLLAQLRAQIEKVRSERSSLATLADQVEKAYTADAKGKEAEDGKKLAAMARELLARTAAAAPAGYDEILRRLEAVTQGLVEVSEKPQSDGASS